MYNYSVDEVIDMLNENNNLDIQKKGIELAANIHNLKLLCQPEGKISSWKNCAIILSSKKDEELINIIKELLDWIGDFNYPGSHIIYERLIKIRDNYKIFRNNIAKSYINCETNFEKDKLINLYSEYDDCNNFNILESVSNEKIMFKCYEQNENDYFLIRFTTYNSRKSNVYSYNSIHMYCKESISNREIKKYSVEIYDENNLLFFTKQEYSCKMKTSDIFNNIFSFKLDYNNFDKTHYTVKITLDDDIFVIDIHYV